MLSINTNLSSLIAQGSMKQSTNKLNQAIERMTTGFKINHAKDNAANYSIATNMTTKIGAYNVAEDNAAMGLDLISTAEGTLDQIEDKLQRLRALQEQAANGTYGEQSLKAINAEANALVDEIERIYNNTEYNGINLMKGRVVGTEESKFIKDIDRRDTSKMTTLASVDETEKLEYGTYSISTAEELAKLATMTNNGLIGADTEFVLANDIDLNGINWIPIGDANLDGPGNTIPGSFYFEACFDGNGYSISNMTTTDIYDSYVGLFGRVRNANIKNVELLQINLMGRINVAGIVGHSTSSIIDNCVVKGIITASTTNLAGIIGNSVNNTIKNCYSQVEISGAARIGGICGTFSSESTIYNCYSNSQLTASRVEPETGGLVGYVYLGTNYIDKSAVLSKVLGLSGIFAGGANTVDNKLVVSNSYYNSLYDVNLLPFINTTYLSEIDNVSPCDADLYAEIKKGNIYSHDSNIKLQVGINSGINSELDFDTGYLLDSLSFLRRIGAGIGDYLTMIDNMLAKASEKLTMFGATSNRLESVLEEITIQRDNLVSSRSTIRDADIAEVSSHYIQQQILQQASATLLATANQSPSIALQHI